VAVKGVDKLVQAMPAIVHEFPNVKLVILGVGDMEQSLRSMADQLGIAQHIVFRTEFISEAERIQHYAAADLVVLPSLYEPFGIVCTEAMSMAKPVVVGARGTNGMREQITPNGDEQCGFHVNPYAPEDIAWGIKQALSLPDKGKAIGKQGRARVLKEFTWETVTKRTLDIYQECLKQ
jgi:glycosyltransferase involved in cell wall biosynthesis